MALSYVEYPSSGSTKAFDLTFGYLSRTHVFAFVNDTLAAYTWVSPTRIELVNIPPENATIKIARLTDRVTRITSFADGQTLLSGDLNAGDLQNFYILQEIADGVADGVVAGTIVVQNPGQGYITEQWIQQQLQAAVGGSQALADLDALIDQEVTNRNAAILAEQQARAAALVTEANARTTVANNLAAELLARAQGDAAEAAARTSAIAAEATTRADAVLSLTQADVGLGQRLTTVESDINTATTGLKAKVATLTTTTTDLANNKADASVVTAIDAKIENPTTGLKARATSLESRVSTVETGKAATTVTDAIDAKIETPTTGLKARATSLEARVTSVESDKAEASTVTALTARVTAEAPGRLNNPRFTMPLVSGIPTHWVNGSNGSGTAVGRSGLASSTAFRLAGGAGANAFVVSQGGADTIRPGEKFRLIVQCVLVSGTYDGAAIYLEWKGADLLTASGSYTLSLATAADISGVVSNSLAGLRTWEVELTAPATTRRVYVSAMSHWTSGAGGVAVANSIDWHQVDLVPTTARLASAEGNITSLQSVVVDLENNKATTSSVASIDAKIETPTTGLKARATSLESRVSTVETGKAATTVTDAIDAKIETPTTGLKARATSLESRVTSVETGKAATTVTDAIDAKIETPTTGLKARATSLETRMTTAETNKAEASVVTALTARVASGDATGLIRNSRFAETLVAGLPPGWSNWSNGTGTAVPRWIHTTGNAFRLVGPAGQPAGLQASSFPANTVRAGSRFRVLIEAVLVSGTYDGAGVHIDWRTAGGVALTPNTISLSVTPDTSGVTSNSAAGFRAWEIEVVAPATAVQANFYVMSHWSSHTNGTAVANSIDWHLVDLVPTTSRISTAESNITTLQTTTANLNTGKAEASTVTALTSRVSNVAGSVGTVTDFAADGLHWATNFGGSPGTIADAANGATYVNVAGVGRCMEVNTFPFYLTPKAAFKPVVGRRYRLTVRFAAGTDATGGNLNVAINNVNGLSELWAHGIPNSTAFAVPGLPAAANVTAAEGFKTIAREWGVTSLGTYDAAWRLRIDVTRSAGSGGTVRIADFKVEDVTDVLAAAARGAAAEGSGLVKNSLFQVPFSGTQIPPDWASFANGTGTQVDRVSGTGKAYRLVSTAGLQSGNQQAIPDGSLKPGRYTMRVKLRRVAGNLDGAAAYISFRNSADTALSDFSFPLATTKNTAGETTTVPDGLTTWEMPVTAPANTSRGNIYFMNHYSPAGSIAATNTIDWYEVDLFPATDADTRVAAAEASITTLQSTTVDLQNNKASATELTSLKASVTPRIGQAQGSLLVNPAFSDYPVASGTVPPGWTDWANGAASSRGTGKVGLFAHIRDGNANADSGIYQQRPITPGKYIMKCTIERSAGTLTSAGVYLEFRNSGGTILADKAFAFELTPDTRGNVGVNVGYDYRQFERPFTVPANTTTINVFLMNHWSGGFGFNGVYNQIYWHQLDIVSADYGTAEVDILKAALATENSSEARVLIKVNTGTNVASFEGLAQSGDGVWNGSAINLTADKIKLQGDVIVTGTLTANEVQSNALTKSAADVKTASQSVTTTYADVQSITLNVPTGASLVKLDWAMRIDGRSLNASPCQTIVRVLRDGVDITGDITMAALEGVTTFDLFNSGVRSATDYVEVEYVINGSFAAFALDVGASAGSRVYTLQVKKDNTGATYTVRRSTFFGVGHAR